MRINQNIRLLKVHLKQHGWELISEDLLFEYYQNYLGVDLKFPKVGSDVEYPKMFEISMARIKKINPEIAKLPVFATLISQFKNLKSKYSKLKHEWILLEPNSIYSLNEIPDIYIPKNYIFDV
ncbi:hypothetical protein [Mucilaginibacter sp. R-33]|uniref:hypothetical protein n=1 Tax=Mucilaginibacter sp. R-33 TaxID=3416711 RepID=UPI003CFB969E